MKRLTVFCGSLFAVAVLSTVAAADVFYSGVVNVQGTLAAGGNNVAGAKQIGATGGGVAYNNIWQGASGGALIGAKITASGVVPISSATVNNTTFGVAPVPNLVAVYAFEGQVSPGPGGIGQQGNFNITGSTNAAVVPGSSFADTGAHGIVRFYTRPAGAGLDLDNPTTWVPNFADLSQGLVAELAIDKQATAYLQGPAQGAFSTAIPVVINTDQVNQFPFDLGGAFLGTSGDLKLQFTNLFNVLGTQAGSLFQNLLVDSNIPTDILKTLDVLVHLDETAFTGAGFPTLVGANLTAMNTLFDALLDALAAGNHLFAGAAPGDTFDNLTNGNVPAAANGDSSSNINGGFGIPGGQFGPPVVEPEPATVAVWCVVCLVGSAAGAMVKKSKIKKVA